MKAHLLLPLLSTVLLASCQSMSEGVVGLEARAIVLDDTSVDDFGSAPSFDEEDLDVSAYGVQASLATPIVDLLGSVDVREYESEDTPEANLGVRRRLLELGPFHPFVEANLRYGFDLDTGATSDGYFGWNAGAGVLVDLSDHVFLNVRLMYETAELEVLGDEVTADGVIATVGLGIHL